MLYVPCTMHRASMRGSAPMATFPQHAALSGAFCVYIREPRHSSFKISTVKELGERVNTSCLRSRSQTMTASRD